MKREQKEPLYRKEKKTGLCTQYYVNRGGEARWSRNTKATKEETENEVKFKPMKKRQLGYDYTPLYRFLHSKTGQLWDSVYSEAKSRLDKEEPIFYIVKTGDDPSPIVRIGESGQWSTMKVVEGVLLLVEENATPSPASCSCCTHTFNGNVLPKPGSYNHSYQTVSNAASGNPTKKLNLG